MPPILNTLDTQPASQKEDKAADRAVPSSAPAEAAPGSALAPAGAAANTPQLPQQSLVAKLNEAAETEPTATKVVPTEDASIAFVTTPGLAEGIQTSAGAAGAGTAGKTGAAGTAGGTTEGATAAAEDQTASAQAGNTADNSQAEQPTDAAPVRTRTSRAAKAAAAAKLTTTSGAKSGGKKAEDRRKCSAGKQDIAESAPAEEASHMAEKEPHSRVDEIKGVKGSSPKQDPAEKRDPLIGRCIKKDFETDKGVQTYTGWIIGKHESRKW